MKKIVFIALILAITLGFAQAFASTQCGTQNCQVCSSLGVCVMCNADYMLNINKDTRTTQCVKQVCSIDNCFRCLTDSACAQCQPGFKLTSLSSCSQADAEPQYDILQVEPCIKKSVVGNCEECSEGFTLVDGECQIRQMIFASVGNSACTTSMNNCSLCLTPNYCIQCTNSSNLPNAEGVCVPVPVNNISNCMFYNGDGTCEVCQSGYVLFNNSNVTNQCLLCNISGCNSCVLDSNSNGTNIICNNSNNTNFGCINRYQYINGTCQLTNCQYPCFNCTLSGACLYCLPPFNPVPFDNYTCYTCTVAYCLTCKNQDCLKCLPGFSLVSGACLFQCSANCDPAFCNGTCSQCQLGFYLSNNGNNCFACSDAPICQNCTAPANSGANTTCILCITGYYLDSNNKCIPNTNSPICLGCTSNFSTNCSFCPNFSGFSTYTSTTLNSTTFPYTCDPGCLTCASNYPSACTSCFIGFYLNIVDSIPICSPCGSNCATCVFGQPNNCLSCYGNGLWTTNNQTGGSCSICNTTLNCVTCVNNINQCTTCPYGYRLVNVDNTDIISCNTACPSNCLTCFNPNGYTLVGVITCTSCETGYSLSSANTCLPCVANCRTCSGSFQNQCLECDYGFYLAVNTYICTSCPQYCLSCNQQGCQQCIPGYNVILNNNNLVCTPACSYPCASCNFNQPTQCTSCLMGFNLNNNTNTCQFSACVTNTTSNVCQYCPLGSILSNSTGNCTQCSGNCARCTQNSTSTCINCFPGFYLTSSTCTACSNGCATCSGPTNCLSCQAGYATISKNSLPVNNNLVYCTPCILPCAQCSFNPELCTACLPGFKFIGWTCVSNFFYTFNATFNADQTSFFKNYGALINRFTYALQTQNNKAVSIQNITNLQTTTNILVYLTTLAKSGSDNAANQFNNLAFALMQANDGTVAGMSLKSSTLFYQGGVVEIGSNSLEMILFICVPLGVVVLLGLIYFACSRNNIDLPGSEYYPPLAETDRSVIEPTEMRSL